jgi:hypothetical protein
MKIEQWDIVRFRIRPEDRNTHPAVVVSPPEWCLDETKVRLNVLACSIRVPADGPKPSQVVLNGADGLDFQVVYGRDFFHLIARGSLVEKIGRVTSVRRRAIGRKLNEVFGCRFSSDRLGESGRRCLTIAKAQRHAQGGTRTRKALRPGDFKSAV